MAAEHPPYRMVELGYGSGSHHWLDRGVNDAVRGIVGNNRQIIVDGLEVDASGSQVDILREINVLFRPHHVADFQIEGPVDGILWRNPGPNDVLLDSPETALMYFERLARVGLRIRGDVFFESEALPDSPLQAIQPDDRVWATIHPVFTRLGLRKTPYTFKTTGLTSLWSSGWHYSRIGV